MYYFCSELFERKIVEIFSDLNGVGVYFDDSIVPEEDELGHHINLHKFWEEP